MTARLALATITALAMATPALADPCNAPVSGYREGQVITGPVVYAGDGDSLCLMLGRDPSEWLEIRTSDWSAPELSEPGGRVAKRVMDGLIGRKAVCAVQRGKSGRLTSYDRLFASCRVEGVPVGIWMRAAGISEGGR